jgi:hypothetical protein
MGPNKASKEVVIEYMTKSFANDNCYHGREEYESKRAIIEAVASIGDWSGEENR